MVSALESIMLVCFGLSWPINVMKAYKARTAKSMSLPFITLIITGYIAGIGAKFLSHTFNYVLGVYFLNLAIVTVNLLMYFRNAALDKKAEAVGNAGDNHENTSKFTVITEDHIMKKYAKEIARYSKLNSFSSEGGVVLFGEEDDKDIPVTEISESLEMKEKVYNRSFTDLYISAAPEVYDSVIAPLHPSTVLLHIGNNDVDFYGRFPGRFDHDYRTLIQHIKSTDSKCRVGIVSIHNEDGSENISRMNQQLKFIAESEKCEFCNITPDTKWSLSAVKAAHDYYYSTGYAVNQQKPVYDLAKIFFGQPEGMEADEINVEVSEEIKKATKATA